MKKDKKPKISPQEPDIIICVCQQIQGMINANKELTGGVCPIHGWKIKRK